MKTIGKEAAAFSERALLAPPTSFRASKTDLLCGGVGRSEEKGGNKRMSDRWRRRGRPFFFFLAWLRIMVALELRWEGRVPMATERQLSRKGGKHS